MLTGGAHYARTLGYQSEDRAAVSLVVKLRIIILFFVQPYILCFLRCKYAHTGIVNIEQLGNDILHLFDNGSAENQLVTM